MKIHGTESEKFNTILRGNFFYKGEVVSSNIDGCDYEVIKHPKLLYEDSYGYELESYFSGKELKTAINHAKLLFKYGL